MTSKDYKKIILEKLSEILRPGLFKKSGNSFSFFNGDITYYLSIQSSMSSNATVLKLTINTEMSSSLLCSLEDVSIPVHQRRHFTKRIGNYLEPSCDKWWEIENIQSLKSAMDEIEDILINKVLPEFETFKTTNDLIKIWQKGQSPGLTDYIRREYLTLLTTDKAK